MKKLGSVMGAVVVSVWVCGAAETPAVAPAESGKAAAVKSQEKCPVMGGAVNKKLYVDYEGKRIYVCCKGCIPELKKNAAKYVEKLEKEGVTLDTVPVAK